MSLSRLALALAVCGLAIGGEAAQPPKAPTVPDGVAAHRDLAYVEKGYERQKLDL